MNETRVTFHEANSVFTAIQAAGKKDLAKRSRAVAFQLYAYEMAFRKLGELIENDAPKAELLKIIDTAMGEKAKAEG